MQATNFWMADVKWDQEPDVREVKRLYNLLPVDSRTALRGLQELAARGSLAAALYIATYFDRQTEDTRDEAECIKWYRKAGAMGSRAALYQLGVKLFTNGNLSGAEAAFKDGADKEFSPSMYRLACIYIDKNDEVYRPKINSLLKKASKKGHLFSTRDYMSRLLSGKYGELERIMGVLMIPVFIFRLCTFIGRAIIKGPYLDETGYA
ncbi:hypothetical protein SAMN05444161_4576 [Rhizobiales bacterium GAS191]|nr:hypothetical protein SAMN05519103_03870 [Rhizobiales bacterium GAS113]SED99366.1 hypothetical protein SAMN05444161_4576 [Rhizobiales bacterium GAS191]